MENTRAAFQLRRHAPGEMVRLDVSINRDDQRVVTSSGINNSLIWVDCTPGA
jgi:hypothetical protein